MAQETRQSPAIPQDDLARAAQEAARTGRRQRVPYGNGYFAVSYLSREPKRAPSRRLRVPSKADIEAALGAVGSWKGLVDAEQLKRDPDEARGSDSARLNSHERSPNSLVPSLLKDEQPYSSAFC
jgi:hypothetical protein